MPHTNNEGETHLVDREVIAAVLDNACSNPSSKYPGFNVYHVELHCVAVNFYAVKRGGKWLVKDSEVVEL